MTGRRTGDLLDVLGRSPNPVFATDASNRVIAWNSGAERLLGYRPDRAVGRFCHELMAGKDVYGNPFCHRNCSLLRAVRDGGVVRWFQVDLEHVSGASIRVNCAPLVLGRVGTAEFTIVHVLESSATGEANLRLGRVGTETRSGFTGTESDGPMSRLTAQERRVLSLLCSGLDTNGIAGELCVSPSTARTHIRNILRKLEVHSRVEAVVIALQEQVVPRRS